MDSHNMQRGLGKSMELSVTVLGATLMPRGLLAASFLCQQLFPTLGRLERRFPDRGLSKPFFFESIRQGGNCDPCRLTSFFYFGGPQACACHLIHQIPNHYRRGFVARQTGLALHLQRVTGFRQIGVVAQGLLASSLIKARRSIRFPELVAYSRRFHPHPSPAPASRTGGPRSAPATRRARRQTRCRHAGKLAVSGAGDGQPSTENPNRNGTLPHLQYHFLC